MMVRQNNLCELPKVHL